jgi:hypothetical protein
MSDEALIRTVLLGVVLCSIYFLVMFVLTGYGTAFYHDCSRITVGMTKDEVQMIMQKYTTDSREFEFGEFRQGAYHGLNWYTEGPFNDYQCEIGLDEAARVESVTKIFG